MHTVDLLEQALTLAAALGIRVRQEWLGGSGGGSCEIRGQRWLFVDLAQTPAEQFAQVAEALIADPGLAASGWGVAVPQQEHPSADCPPLVSIPITPELHRALRLNKTA